MNYVFEPLHQEALNISNDINVVLTKLLDQQRQQAACFGVAINFPVMLYDPFNWGEFLLYCNTPCSKYEVNDDKFPY